MTENSVLDKKQFVFQKGYFTEQAIFQLIDQINNDSAKTRLSIFVDLAKAFNIVDHKILLRKLRKYEEKGNNLRGFDSYLKNQKQYFSYGNNWITYTDITCGVPQSSLFGSLLFLNHANDLPNASNLLDPIMFTSDKNPSYSPQVKTLFATINNESEKIG